MPRFCSVCNHSLVVEINRALLNNEAYRSIAKRFGVGDSAMFRHRTDHLAVALAREADGKKTGDILDPKTHSAEVGSGLSKGPPQLSEAGLISDLPGIHVDLKQIFSESKKAGAHETAIKAARAIQGGMDLDAKVRGLYVSPVTSITVNVGVVMPLSADDQPKIVDIKATR